MSDDNCSTSPDNPIGFPFETACDRHDFGYRNFKMLQKLESLPGSSITPFLLTQDRDDIDNNLTTDLYWTCENVTSHQIEGDCKLLADAYYFGVTTGQDVIIPYLPNLIPFPI